MPCPPPRALLALLARLCRASVKRTASCQSQPRCQAPPFCAALRCSPRANTGWCTRWVSAQVETQSCVRTAMPGAGAVLAPRARRCQQRPDSCYKQIHSQAWTGQRSSARMGLCSLRAAGVRSVLGAQRSAPAACSTAAPSPGVQARAHTRQPWELASTEPALTASPPAAVPAQRGQRGRQCRQAAVETQSLNGPSAGGAANTVWPPPGRRELLGAARDLQAGSGAGRRRVGSLEVEDIVSREREACIEDQAARTRHGGDLCAAYLQPDAGEEVPHGRPASWLHHAAHCGPAQCAGD